MGVEIVIKLLLAVFGIIKELAGQNILDEALGRIRSESVSLKDFKSIAPDDEYSEK